MQKGHGGPVGRLEVQAALGFEARDSHQSEWLVQSHTESHRWDPTRTWFSQSHYWFNLQEFTSGTWISSVELFCQKGWHIERWNLGSRPLEAGGGSDLQFPVLSNLKITSPPTTPSVKRQIDLSTHSQIKSFKALSFCIYCFFLVPHGKQVRLARTKPK